MHGFGEYHYVDGKKYFGEFYENMKHGVGTMTAPDQNDKL